jgi:MOSC domain-containing protein YiiM
MHGRLVSVQVPGGAAVSPPVSPALNPTAGAAAPPGRTARVWLGAGAPALWAYPQEHAAFWQTVRAQAGVTAWTDVLEPGALGEALTVRGVLEADVWIGDVWRLPDCELAVSAPGRAGVECNAALGFPQAAQLMRDSGWCGWWLDVRAPGSVGSGDAFEVVPGPREVGVAELFRARAGRARLP